jgi:DNA-binding MarR family transcriptional regulator
MLGMGVTHSTSRNAVRLALVTNPPPAAPDAPTGVPAGLRLLRSLDRSVLETARDVDLRPMELYALLILSDAPEGVSVTTRALSEQLAASPSQAKQIALRLASRGFAERSGSQGRTRLTESGRDLANDAIRMLEYEICSRLNRIEPGTVARGAAQLNALVSG